MEKELICINCPMGCRLSIVMKSGHVEMVKGNVCSKGVEYAKQEAVNPIRVVTALMRAANREKPFSVKTAAPIPKHLIFQCIEEIYHTHPKAPVAIGDTVIPNVCGTNVNIVATQDVL